MFSAQFGTPREPFGGFIGSCRLYRGRSRVWFRRHGEWRPGLTVGDLARAVDRDSDGMTRRALQQATGLSARTLRDVLSAANRRFARPTLDKLDDPLGWPPGQAWRLYRQEAPAAEEPDARTVELIRAQMDAVAARVATLEEQPTWAGEVLDAFRRLTLEDRATLLAMARRLVDRE